MQELLLLSQYQNRYALKIELKQYFYPLILFQSSAPNLNSPRISSRILILVLSVIGRVIIAP